MCSHVFNNASELHGTTCRDSLTPRVLPHARAESKVLIVAPQDGRPSLDGRFAHNVVQVHDLVATAVAHQHDEAARARLHPIFDQRAHARVHLLPRHVGGVQELKM